MNQPADCYASTDFCSYQELLKFVIHVVNIRHHIPLDRLSKYSTIPFSRLDEARKIRTDRKQCELTHAEHTMLVCTLFELGAEDLALTLVRWGTENYIQAEARAFDRARIRTQLHNTIEQLKELEAHL